MQREQGSPRCPGAAGGRPGKGVSAARHSQRGGGRAPGRDLGPLGVRAARGAAPAATPGAAKRELADAHRTLCADLCRDPIPCSFGGGVQIAWLPAVLTSQNRRRPNSHKARLTKGPRATPTKAGPPLAGQPVPSPAGVAGCALGPRPQEQRSLPADRNGGSQETFACAPKPSGAFARPAGVGEPVSAVSAACPTGGTSPRSAL